MGIRIPDPGSGKTRPDAAGSEIARGGDLPLTQQAIERWQTTTGTERKDLHGNNACIIDDKTNAPFFNEPDYGGTFHIVTGASQAIKEALAPCFRPDRPEVLVRLEFAGPDPANPRNEKSMQVVGRLVDLLNKDADLRFESASRNAQSDTPIGTIVRETQTPGWRLKSIAVSEDMKALDGSTVTAFVPLIDVARLSLVNGLDPAKSCPYEKLAALKGATMAVTVKNKEDNDVNYFFGEVSGIERDSAGKITRINFTSPGKTERSFYPEYHEVTGIKEVALDRTLSRTETDLNIYPFPRGTRLEIELGGVPQTLSGLFLGTLSSREESNRDDSMALQTADGVVLIPFHTVKGARVQTDPDSTQNTHIEVLPDYTRRPFTYQVTGELL